MNNSKVWKIGTIIFVFVLMMLSFGFCEYLNSRYAVLTPMVDYEYKKEIVKKSKNLSYKVENLRSLVGHEELKTFIKDNDENPKAYSLSYENLKNGEYRANLHMHTLNSDGAVSVESRLNEAQSYAQQRVKDGYMWIAITDHNTVNGAKEVIDVLQKNPGKYKNIKVVAGLEIFTKDYTSKILEKPVEQHILLWCINPYDEFLNKEFYKSEETVKSGNKNNWKEPPLDYEWIIKTMSEYGIVGIAHPARFASSLDDRKREYIRELFDRYKNNCKNFMFTEGYYQTYVKQKVFTNLGDDFEPFLNFINEEAKARGIYRTGSTDAHGETMFKL